MARDFFQVFPQKSIIGMIHLAGEDRKEKVERALEEIAIFEGEGLQGAIVEDYHGTVEDVKAALEAINEKQTSLVLGVNVLSNPIKGFILSNRYRASFVQFDTIHSPPLDLELYNRYRRRYPNIAVLGGVRFKYQEPTGRCLEEDIKEGVERCDAIVTTGEGTGMETPIEKLREFRKILTDFPKRGFVVGAGVTDENVWEQMEVCDAAIMGSYFKGGATKRKVIPENVRRIRDILDGYLET